MALAIRLRNIDSSKAGLPSIVIPSPTEQYMAMRFASAAGRCSSAASRIVAARSMPVFEIDAAPSSILVRIETSSSSLASLSVSAMHLSRKSRRFSCGMPSWQRSVSMHILIDATGVFSSWLMLLVNCFFIRSFSFCSCSAARCWRSRSDAVCCRRA